MPVVRPDDGDRGELTEAVRAGQEPVTQRYVTVAELDRLAEEHDRIVAFTSHLAQLASTALAATVAEHAGDHLAVAGPGLADTTRLALSPFELWRDILATNSSAIELALTAYIIKLEHLRDNLRTREIESEFEIASALAATLRK